MLFSVCVCPCHHSPPIWTRPRNVGSSGGMRGTVRVLVPSLATAPHLSRLSPTKEHNAVGSLRDLPNPSHRVAFKLEGGPPCCWLPIRVAEKIGRNPNDESKASNHPATAAHPTRPAATSEACSRERGAHAPEQTPYNAACAVAQGEVHGGSEREASMSQSAALARHFITPADADPNLVLPALRRSPWPRPGTDSLGNKPTLPSWKEIVHQMDVVDVAGTSTALEDFLPRQTRILSSPPPSPGRYTPSTPVSEADSGEPLQERASAGTREDSVPCTVAGSDVAPCLSENARRVSGNPGPYFCSVNGCPRGTGTSGFARKNELIR